MKYRLNGGWFATCALSFIIIILLVEFGQSIPLVRRRRYSSLSEQTLAHHNRHKNAKSQSDDLNGLTSARVADGVFETEESTHVPDGEDVTKILRFLQNML